ncbi:hypothetical protein GCM10023346_00320 [Arthrobacter gyeryongensis]|uniref:DUF4190 domain-containing protein n=1 Tax=Arthrobacter gyeryongensis TaxID=1650592 RepID=A0ABP9RXP5_9MICC
MGRLFDGPWPIIIIFLIVIGGVVALVMSLTNKSRKVDQAFLGAVVPPQGSATGVYGPGGSAGLQPHLYMQGMSHRSTATTFGVIGLFVLGIVFGPLALVQANKAEALGVKATAGKVLGWISVAFAILWLLFIVGRIF